MPNYLAYYLPVVAIFAAYFVFAIATRRKYRQMTATMSAGDVAKALGMSIVSGDPAFNLGADAPSRGVLGWLLSSTPLPYAGPATEIVARGELDARATELYFYAKLTAGWRLARYAAREMDIVQRCRLSVAPRAQAGDFELLLRHPPPGSEVERALPALPAAAFGDARLDQRYALFASSPNVAHRLSGAMRVLDDQAHVHIVGEGGRVAMSFTRGATYQFAGAPRAFLEKLDVVTRAIEGSF